MTWKFSLVPACAKWKLLGLWSWPQNRGGVTSLGWGALKCLRFGIGLVLEKLGGPLFVLLVTSAKSALGPRGVLGNFSLSCTKWLSVQYCCSSTLEELEINHGCLEDWRDAFLFTMLGCYLEGFSRWHLTTHEVSASFAYRLNPLSRAEVFCCCCSDMLTMSQLLLL